GKVRIFAAPCRGDRRDRQIARAWRVRRPLERQRADRPERDPDLAPVPTQLDDVSATTRCAANSKSLNLAAEREALSGYAIGDTRFRQRQPACAVLRQSHCVPLVYPSAGLLRPP